jgi:hypothetical protein
VVPGKRLLVNEINPVKLGSGCFGDECLADEDGTTCFSGNVSLEPGKTLLVNQINPADPYDCTVADEDGLTCFRGNVGVANTKVLLVN